ncbi:TPA: hypothetical protein KAB36_004981 [Escherichia coli]|nr:hypothetical protein [Escherichia coli]HBB2981264.1 hypothetical protein [Escherichia coli]HBB3028191.1 hypothetical protein [Escherichia coli]HBB3033190.1 hypothetical protein [Escherichia coli]HBB3038787.1 hypothetical protein [Escherichia coli]
MTRVNDRVSSLVSDTARLAHYSADTREQLLTLADQVHHKLNHLEEKLHRVDQVQRAQLHLEQIFSWWSAGRYASFSPAGRCYVALEELRWGAFGDVIRQGETGQVNQLLDILRHKALTQMAQESGGSATVRLNTLDWLGGQGREQADNEWHDAINWLGDWCSEEQHPVIWSEGGMQDIIDCIRAELGVGTTKNAVFQHIQSLPRGQQKEALLASAALPLLFRPREVQGTMFGDGGMGGWRNMQGNTPVTPLVDAGCNMVIVTHLSDGSLWDRQAFPDTTILEIRPRKRLKYAGDGGNSGGLLSFTSAHTDAWRQQGYEDTMLAMEHIRKPLAARQALTRSEAVLQKSLDITEEADLALRNAMARIK